MSSNVFINAGATAILFLIMKFIEMRFIEKENKPLKFLVRDTLIVYCSVISGYFILEQLNPVIVSEIITPVFTDNPGF